MMYSSLVADFALDITGEVCPMTYVRTRLALERLQTGQILAVTLKGSDAASNVPRSAIRHGHAVVAQEAGEGGITRLLLRRG